MKKIISFTLVCLLICTSFSLFAFAKENENETTTVYVSISSKGNIQAANVKVSVSDIDNDGKTTINDALYALHEAKYQGGADKGYSYYKTEQYGLSIGTLWGDKSGCFGYYVNDASAWSLEDEVKNGDRVYAFVYSDMEYWSDSYSFFDKSTVSAVSGGEIALTLFKSGYDENWNTITEPFANAAITINGEKTDYVTDKNGKVSIKTDKIGSIVISAVSTDSVIVPPVCVANISSTSDKVTPSDESNVLVLVFAAIAALAVCTIFVKRLRKNEL